MRQEEFDRLQKLLIDNYKKYAKKKKSGFFWFEDEEYGPCSVFYNYRNGILLSGGSIEAYRSGAPLKTIEDVMYFYYDISLFTLFDKDELSHESCRKSNISTSDVCKKTGRVPVITATGFDGEDGIIQVLPRFVESILNLNVKEMNKIRVKDTDISHHNYHADFMGLSGINGSVDKNICFDKKLKKEISERYRFYIGFDSSDRTGLSVGVTFYNLTRKEMKLIKRMSDVFIYKTITKENEYSHPNSKKRNKYLYKPGKYFRFISEDDLVSNPEEGAEIVELNSSEWHEMHCVYFSKEDIYYMDYDNHTAKELQRKTKRQKAELLATYLERYMFNKPTYECYKFFLKTKGWKIAAKVKEIMKIENLKTEEEFFDFVQNMKKRD